MGEIVDDDAPSYVRRIPRYSTGRREKVEVPRENDNSEDPQPECWRGDTEYRCGRHDHVALRILMLGGIDSDRNSDQEREEESGYLEFQRCHNPGSNISRDCSGIERPSEVALQEIGQP